MSDTEWAEVRSAMPVPVPAWLLKLGGRPETFCHREMLDPVRYLVDSGVKWMAVPVDFPYWLGGLRLLPPLAGLRQCV
ncbi:transposase [Streptomyces sp. NPDC057199]|uniref:transposase n=1 Tax=Streptomyces sp. NPDC057199 TaxID=3346047 RepID=UPI00363F734C